MTLTNLGILLIIPILLMINERQNTNRDEAIKKIHTMAVNKCSQTLANDLDVLKTTINQSVAPGKNLQLIHEKHRNCLNLISF